MKILLCALALCLASSFAYAQETTPARAQLNQAMDTAQSDFEDATGSLEVLEEKFKSLKPGEFRRFYSEATEARQAAFVASKSYMRAILAASAYEIMIAAQPHFAKEQKEIATKLTPLYTKPLTERAYDLMDKVALDMQAHIDELEKRPKPCPAGQK